jgi:short subunit dehydrogenase-like uncharacterized protein
MTKKILLLGAYGYTGRLITKKLIGQKITFTACGRNLEKLQKLKTDLKEEFSITEVDTLNINSVKSILGQYDIVINTVGPFSQFSREVIRLSAEIGKTYLDITGEQAFVKESWELLNDIAIKNKATIICSCSFESAIADFAASQICDSVTKYSEISSYYEIKDTKPSPGTRLTMQIAVSQKTFINENSQMTSKKPLEVISIIGNEDEKLKAHFIPYPEVFFYSKEYQVKNCGTYFVMSDIQAAFLKRAISTEINISEIINKQKASGYEGPDEAARQKQLFSVWVKAIEEAGETKTIKLSGTDMYGLTAEIIAKGIKHLLSSKSVKPGFLSFAQAFGNAPFVKNLIQNLSLH